MNHFKYIPPDILSSQIPKEFSNDLYFSERIDGYIHHTYNSVYSIKFQISGAEIYKIGDREFTLRENSYLVVNNEQSVTSFPFKTKRAITIFIEPSILMDVFYNLKKDEEILLSNPFDFSEDNVIFLENCFSITNDDIGKELKHLAKSFDDIKRKQFRIKEDYFFRIAKSLIISQQETLQQVMKIKSVKRSTKTELYKRVYRARQIITDNWNKAINLSSIASLVYMSPYHFNRTFSNIFQIPPMEYHLNVRLDKAKDLLATGKYSVADVAELVGYNDIFAFSKAYKKHFGYSPSLTKLYV